jgi:hypothetical protein
VRPVVWLPSAGRWTEPGPPSHDIVSIRRTLKMFLTIFKISKFDFLPEMPSETGH